MQKHCGENKEAIEGGVCVLDRIVMDTFIEKKYLNKDLKGMRE